MKALHADAPVYTATFLPVSIGANSSAPHENFRNKTVPVTRLDPLILDIFIRSELVF